jgi:hypothetical protein
MGGRKDDDIGARTATCVVEAGTRSVRERARSHLAA